VSSLPNADTDDAFSRTGCGETGALDYGLWISRILRWDGLLPVFVFLASVAIAVLFPQNGAVQTLALLALPIAAFICRVNVGHAQINSNGCGQWVRLGQFVALGFALLLFVAFDFILVLLEFVPKGQKHPPPEDVPIWIGMIVAYFALVSFAMYPGRGLASQLSFGARHVEGNRWLVFDALRRWLQRIVSPHRGATSAMSNQRLCELCKEPQTFHITDISRSGDLTERHVCEACAQSILRKPYRPAPPTSRNTRAREVQIEVERIVITEIYHEQVIVFREIDGERRCPLLIGIFEATALDRFLKGFTAPRPLTHDAWLATVEGLGANLQMACITGRSESLENTYLAELRFDHLGTQVRVDARPSDAVTIALMAGSPIYMSNDLLTSADQMIQWGA
jgi:bifunctional DNase/RNase